MIKRRTFFKYVFGGLGAAVAPPVRAVQDRRTLIQESPIAGFQFHEGEFVWPSLEVGKELTLVREADNIHDADAVAVYFRDDQLGYVPRVDNTAIAQMLDRGEKLEASISTLNETDNPWDRVWFNVFLT